MATLRLMSHNLWNRTDNIPGWEERGLDCSAALRMKSHIRVYQELMPDIIGGQEINRDMYPLLKFYSMDANIPYSIIWENFTPIVYRADKLELLANDYVLYPKKVEGFNGEYNDVESKSCNIGVFRNKESGKVFIFATTHLWWQPETMAAGSDAVRRLQLKTATEVISDYQKKYDGCPVILVGDMNTGYNTPAIQYALNDGGYKHAHDIATDFVCEGVGYNDCGFYGPGDKWWDKPFEEAIDHILVKDADANSVKRFDRYTPDYYLTVSDHAPVYIDIEL